jgi:hypothetical protein
VRQPCRLLWGLRRFFVPLLFFCGLFASGFLSGATWQLRKSTVEIQDILDHHGKNLEDIKESSDRFCKACDELLTVLRK